METRRKSPRKLEKESVIRSGNYTCLSTSHKSSSSPKKTRLGHGATSNYHNGKKKSSKTNRSEAKILGSPTKHSLKSQSSDSENESTPESVESDHDDVAKTLPPATAHTPYEVRLKVKSRLRKMTVDDCQSESDDSESKNSSSSSDQDISESKDTVTKETSQRRKPVTKGSPLKPSRLATPKKSPTMPNVSSQSRAEEYFLAQQSRIHTSNHTISELEMPNFDRETTKEIILNTIKPHKDNIDSLLAEHRKQFPKWAFQLSQGFNLLLYGVGSKISLLQEFRESVTDEFTVLVVNGFFPSITIKEILNSITSEILDYKGEFQKPEDQVTFIHSTLETSDIGEVLIIVNSIDGVMLRQERTQNILCSLAKGKHIHMIASIDHINASLLWDQAKMCSFNWLWHDATTFLPYIEEMSYENSFLSQQTGRLALSSLLHVFHSLTPNAKGIFLLLARYQLKNKENSTTYIGMAFQDCYQQCRESFLVNSELTLKVQLTEFKDHKLLKVKQGPDGGDHLLIPLDSSTISEFLAQAESAL